MGAHLELGDAQRVERAGIGSKHQLGSSEHQAARALRKLAVITDHRSDAQRALGGIEIRGAPSLAGSECGLEGEFA